MTQTIRVRSGTAADLPAVFALVQELAVYERAGGEVATSAEQYRLDLAAGWFDTLVAERTADGAVVGIMLFYGGYSTWKGRMLYLEDFVVAEDARRSGVGEALWVALVAHARTLDCALVKWQVLDWNEPALAFYRRAGADLDGEWVNGRLLL